MPMACSLSSTTVNKLRLPLFCELDPPFGLVGNSQFLPSSHTSQARPACVCGTCNLPSLWSLYSRELPSPECSPAACLRIWNPEARSRHERLTGPVVVVLCHRNSTPREELALTSSIPARESRLTKREIQPLRCRSRRATGSLFSHAVWNVNLLLPSGRRSRRLVAPSRPVAVGFPVGDISSLLPQREVDIHGKTRESSSPSCLLHSISSPPTAVVRLSPRREAIQDLQSHSLARHHRELSNPVRSFL